MKQENTWYSEIGLDEPNRLPPVDTTRLTDFGFKPPVVKVLYYEGEKPIYIRYKG